MILQCKKVINWEYAIEMGERKRMTKLTIEDLDFSLLRQLLIISKLWLTLNKIIKARILKLIVYLYLVHVFNQELTLSTCTTHSTSCIYYVCIYYWVNKSIHILYSRFNITNTFDSIYKLHFNLILSSPLSFLGHLKST